MTEQQDNSGSNSSRAVSRQDDARFPEEYRHSSADDEISLIDLWLVLLRRKWVILAVFLLTCSGGVVYALLSGTEQKYITPVEIGTYVSGEQGQGESRIESSQEVITRLSQSIYPSVADQIKAKREELKAEGVAKEELPKLFRVEVIRPGADEDVDMSGGVVLLRTRASSADEDEVKALHRRVLERLKEHHGAILDRQQARYENLIERQRLELRSIEDDRRVKLNQQRAAIEKAKDNLEEVKSQGERRRAVIERDIAEAEDLFARGKGIRKRLQERLQNLSDRREYLEQRRQFLEDMVAQFRAAEGQRIGEVAEEGGSGALGVLLRGSVTAEIQRDLAYVREDLVHGLADRRLELEGRVSKIEQLIQSIQREIEAHKLDLAQFDAEQERNLKAAERNLDRARLELESLDSQFKRKVGDMRLTINEMELQKEEFEPTSASIVATPSAEAATDNKRLMLALAAVLGLMLGVFGAFLVEFHMRAKEAMQGGGSGD